MKTLNIYETENPQNNEKLRFEYADGDNDVAVLVWKDGGWKNGGTYEMATFQAGLKKMEAMGWEIQESHGQTV